MEAAGEIAFALLDGVWLSPLGLALLDRDLRFVQVNDAFARFTGLPADAHLGKAPRDLYLATDARALITEERLRAVVDSGEPAVDAATSSRGADGSLRSWRASLYPVLMPGGEARGICALVEETTSARGRELALEQARAAADWSARRLALLQAITAALSAAVEPADVAAAVVQHVRHALSADAVSLRTLAPEGLVPLASDGSGPDNPFVARVVTRDERIPSADAVRADQAVWLESFEALAVRYPNLVDSARAEGYEACAALPLRTRGRVLGSLSLMFRGPRAFDLEERAFVATIAEQCAQALDRALLFEAERAQRAAAQGDRAALDGIFENAPLGIGLFDRDLRFVRVNPVLAEMNGAPAEAHVGRSPGEVMPTLAWEEVAAGLRRVLETGVPRLDAPVSLPGAHGEVRHFLEAWYPVRIGGETVGIGAIIREVTAEREAEEFQRHVLGIVGHDLRTPLATVATAAHLLGRGDPLTERQARLVSQIGSGAARIEQVVSVLLDYTQARGGRGIPVRRRACDLAALCRAVAEECEAANPGRSVRCGGEGDAAGEWDPDRLGQALANLVLNALDYSPSDTTVELRWSCGPDEVAIAVANEGAPIPPEVLPRLFEPFRRGKRERPGKRGLGLGLFIARAIAVAHGGHIEVRSDERGTEFTIRLPRRPRRD